MCGIQCTGEEIASVLGCSYDTLERCCKKQQKMKFADYIADKRKKGNVSLRRSQWSSATGGNVTMQIWLGKNVLGQSDKIEERKSVTVAYLKDELDKVIDDSE
jgi:hypothetical protein